MGGSNVKLQALHRAVTEDNADKVRDILTENGLDVNARGDNDLTALHIAVSHGSLKSVQVLVESGRCDLTTCTPSLETPLILAAAKGKEDVARFLMDAENTLHLSARDRKGLCVLHYASMHGLERLVQILIDKEADVEARGGKLKHTPLMLAAQNGHEGTTRLLLQTGCSVSTVDLVRMTALHYACMANSEQCAQLILQCPGVMVDAEDVSGCTPLVYCLKNNNKAMEKLLVSHGASLTVALDMGFSELCYHTLQEERN